MIMILPMYEEIPMKCIKVSFDEDKFYHIFLQDDTDVSSCMSITDNMGLRLDFNEWDSVLLLLNFQTK
jgi:hypothetical protein